MKSVMKRLFLLAASVLFLSVFCPNLLPQDGVNTVKAAVKINQKKVTLVKGKKVQLKITGTKKKVKWSSSKKSVAVVSSKGKVTAKKKGKATITAKVGKKKYKCKVTVINASEYVPVKEVYFCSTDPHNGKDETSIQEGTSKRMEVRILPANATDKSIQWKSSDSSIVSVAGGKITAHKLGKATITAICGKKKIKCKVKVGINKAEAEKNVEITTQGEGNNVFVTARNNYKYPVALSIYGKFLKNGSNVYENDTECAYLESGSETILECTDFFGKIYDDYQLTFSIDDIKEDRKDNISGISCTVSTHYKGVIAEFINHVPDIGNSQTVKAVFYKDGKIYEITGSTTIYIKNIGSKETVEFRYPRSQKVIETPDMYKICINDIVVYTGTP